MLWHSPKGMKSEHVPNGWDKRMGKKLVSVLYFCEEWSGLPRSVDICVNGGVSSIKQVKNGWV